MPAWLLPVGFILVFAAIMVLANRKMGGIRKDGRPNQLPWGIIMVFCAMGIFIAIVHLINVAGFETGPEHSLLGRFGG